MKLSAFFFPFFLLFLSIPFISDAQSSGSPNLPNRVQANFNAKFPNHTGSVNWKETDNGYEATIRQSNKEIVSDFNKEGRWVQSRTEVKEGDVPNSIKKYMDDSYMPYAYQHAYRYDTKKGSRYEIVIRRQDKNSRLEFDKDGVFIKESPL